MGEFVRRGHVTRRGFVAGSAILAVGAAGISLGLSGCSEPQITKGNEVAAGTDPNTDTSIDSTNNGGLSMPTLGTITGFNHICFMTSDINECKKLWVDVLGFNAIDERTLPDGDDEYSFFNQETLDDIFHVKDAKSIMLILINDAGISLEFQQSLNPAPTKTAKDELQYLNTGVHEVAFTVTNINELFERIKDAGYETQTDYIWEVPGSRSFLFYDFEGNMIQFNEVLNMPSS